MRNIRELQIIIKWLMYHDFTLFESFESAIRVSLFSIRQ